MWKLIWLSALVLFFMTLHGNATYTIKRVGNGYTVTSESKQFLLELKIQKNWYGALHACRDLGMDLATFEEPQEEEAIYETLRTKEVWEEFWIGLNNLEYNNTHQFYWVGTGERLDTLQNWTPNNPDNYRGQENCVNLIHKKKQGWNDNHCLRKKRYICSREYKAARQSSSY